MTVKHTRLKVRQSKNWGASILVLLILLSSYSVYMVVYPSIGTPIQFGLLALGFAVFMLHFCRGKRPIKKTTLLLPWVVFCILLCASIINGTDVCDVVLRLLRFIAVYYIVVVLADMDVDVFRVLYQVIFTLALFMLICYFVFDFIVPSAGLTIYYYISDKSDGTTARLLYYIHYGIYARWAVQNILFGLQFPRLSGFCWEPGQYQMYLNYVLIHLLFFEKKIKWKRVLLIVISLFCTFSAMGWLIAIIVVCIWVWRKKNSIIKWVSMVICTIIGVYACYQIIVEKMATAVYSFDSRSSEFDLIADIFIHNSIFGTPVIVQNMANTVLRFLWFYGYIALVLISLIVISFIRNRSLGIDGSTKTVLGIWLILSLFNEPLEYANITFFFVSIVICNWQSKTNERSSLVDKMRKLT